MDKQQINFFKVFISETRDILNLVSDCLIELEKNPQDGEVINDLFRHLHTLKGNSSLDGFEKLTGVAHSLEGIFDSAREGTLILDKHFVDTAFEAIDLLEKLSEGLITGEYNEIDITPIIEELEAIQKHGGVNTEVQIEKKLVGSIKLNSHERELLKNKLTSGIKLYLIDLRFINAPSGALNTFIITANLKPLSVVILTSPEEEQISKIKSLAKSQILLCTSHTKSEIEGKVKLNCQDYAIIETDINRIPTAEMELDKKQDGSSIKEKRILKENDNKELKKKPGTTVSLFVEVEKLVVDGVIENVGELVLNMNFTSSLMTDILEDENLGLSEMREQLKHLNAQVQSTALFCNTLLDYAFLLRLVPLKPLFRKFPRIVRDAARKVNKKINLEMQGEAIRVDQEIMNMLEAPLIHILRNSVDHGIETPEARLKAGKTEIGTVSILAVQRERDITIEIRDDGAGINTDKVLEKAIGKKLVTQKEAKKLSREKIYDVLFHPGFSTQEKAGELSGRVAGMDVVQHEVKKIGGTIEVQSETGKGTTFRLKFPMIA